MGDGSCVRGGRGGSGGGFGRWFAPGDADGLIVLAALPLDGGDLELALAVLVPDRAGGGPGCGDAEGGVVNDEAGVGAVLGLDGDLEGLADGGVDEDGAVLAGEGACAIEAADAGALCGPDVDIRAGDGGLGCGIADHDHHGAIAGARAEDECGGDDRAGTHPTLYGRAESCFPCEHDASLIGFGSDARAGPDILSRWSLRSSALSREVRQSAVVTSVRATGDGGGRLRQAQESTCPWEVWGDPVREGAPPLYWFHIVDRC